MLVPTAFLLYDDLPTAKEQAAALPALITSLRDAQALTPPVFKDFLSRASNAASRCLLKRDAVSSLLTVASVAARAPAPRTDAATATGALRAALRAADAAAPAKEAAALFRNIALTAATLLGEGKPSLSAGAVAELVDLCVAWDTYAPGAGLDGDATLEQVRRV